MISHSAFLRSKSRVGFFVLLALFPLSISSQPILPIVPTEPDNPDEVLLGKQLFHSVKLSHDNTISCASCHNVSEGGDDGLVVSVGINGQLGKINSPTVLNSALNAFQFWDGRTATLEEQVQEPIHNPVEMGSNWQDVIKKLSRDQDIVSQFRRIYDDGLTQENIARAIASYERQLVTTDAPFDNYLNGESDALTDQARQGYHLFKQMGCISCHQGKNVGGNMFQYFGIMGNYFQDRGNITESDYGRYNVTGKEEDRFKFKVPSLRNIAKTAPYFHDGSAETLEEAIRVMARYQLGRPISDDQVAKIKAFLETLTGHVRKELL